MGGNLRKTIQALAFSGLVFLLLVASGWQPAKAETDSLSALATKIMPFGDSITSSLNPNSSYRCYLDHMLDDAQYNYIFSGSRTGDSYGNDPPPCGDPLADFDHRNEGYSGAMAWDFLYNTTWGNTIDEILNRQIAGTAKTNIPHIVLMDLGINDLGNQHSINQIISDLGSLIDHFRAKDRTVIILIAQITPCDAAKWSWCSGVPGLNAAIPALAAQKSTVISPVEVVDQYTGFNVSSDTGDGMHANGSGDLKMASRWMEKIQKWWNYTVHEVYLPAVVMQ